MRSLPTRSPRRNHETAAFWDGCARGQLLLPRCDDCGQLIWYPRLVCPFCGSHSVTYTEVSGRATDEIVYYEILAAFKLAIVLEGQYSRLKSGQLDNPKIEAFGAIVPDMLAKAVDLSRTAKL